MATSSIPKTQDQWRQALADLPSTPDNIPAFFFGHGSPMLAMPSNASSGFGSPMIVGKRDRDGSEVDMLSSSGTRL